MRGQNNRMAAAPAPISGICQYIQRIRIDNHSPVRLLPQSAEPLRISFEPAQAGADGYTIAAGTQPQHFSGRTRVPLPVASGDRGQHQLRYGTDHIGQQLLRQRPGYQPAACAQCSAGRQQACAAHAQASCCKQDMPVGTLVALGRTAARQVNLQARRQYFRRQEADLDALPGKCSGYADGADHDPPGCLCAGILQQPRFRNARQTVTDA